VKVALAYHVVFPQAVSYIMWFGLIRTASASSASLGTLLVPIFGVAGAIAILGERPDPTDFIGFALILAGIALDQGWRTWRARTA
jgi:drug/metabolite transporter (DMT)-like permease